VEIPLSQHWHWEKKKNSWVGVISWYHRVDDTWRFQKYGSLTLSKNLFILYLKKTALHGFSIPINPNFSEFAIFGNSICRLGLVNFNLASNWWVSQLEKFEFAVLVTCFEKLALRLETCGRTTENAYFCIYSLCIIHS
jgi:hypothetical protein